LGRMKPSSRLRRDSISRRRIADGVHRSNSTEYPAGLRSAVGPRVVPYVKEEAREALRAQYRHRLEPYNPRHDVWLHYFRPHDVAAWGSFLESRILRMASGLRQASGSW